MNPVQIVEGDGPVILGQPHSGTWLPDDVLNQLNDNGRLLADTDWHIDRLYEQLLPSATIVRANFHRYLIDANRDPSGDSLYPGQNTTGLVPETDFDGQPIWKTGHEPTVADVELRLRKYHQVYHAALDAQLKRVHDRYGVALLYDCHSIRSEIPFLFPGRLPDLNVGTDNDQTCSREIAILVAEECAAASDFSHVINGRFRGGWTTRYYGRPESGWHAVQMELAQINYLKTEQPPFDYDQAKATRLRQWLGRLLAKLEQRMLQLDS